MNKIVIGINQRIPVPIMEAALFAVLHDEQSPEYFAELASREYHGANRIKKAVSVINRLTEKNPLIGFLKENKEAVIASLRSKNDRTVLFTSLICAAYPFGYDALALLGKYFHVQKQVNTTLIIQKMAAKYGSNRSLPNALYSVLPMFIEAGILSRPQPGLYEAERISRCNDFTTELYRRAFVVNNPTYKMEDDFDNHPFFEFINK